MPVHLLDLTAAPNVVAGAATYPTVGWQVGFSNETNASTVSFTGLAGTVPYIQNSIGVTTNVESRCKRSRSH